MSVTVTVVDYGIGNVYSVCQAIRQLGGEARLTDSPQEILDARRLILPGVGSFRRGMDHLASRGLDEIVRKYCAGQRPFLGICLGMQMLMDMSHEMGCHQGLGLIPGSVDRIEDTDARGHPHKVPHIAWAPLLLPPGAGADYWQGTLLSAITPGRETFYFVHSYAVRPDHAGHVLAEAEYDGRRFVAAVRRGNVMGTQFHPERSGPAGLAILRQFMQL